MKEDALSKSGGHKHYTEFNHSEISGVSEIYIAISKSPRNLILMGSLILTQVFFNLYSHTDRKDTWWFRHILRFAFQRQPLTHLSKLVTVLNLYIFSSKALQGEMNKPLVATCSMHTSQSQPWTNQQCFCLFPAVSNGKTPISVPLKSLNLWELISLYIK